MTSARIFAHITPKIDDQTDPFMAMLIRHEHAMAKLYAIIAEQIEESTKLWRRCAKRKLQHVHLLEDLAAEISAQRAVFDHHADLERSLQSSLKSVQARVSLWSSQGVTVREASHYMYLLEKGMLETCLATITFANSKQATGLLGKLRKASRKHLDELRDIKRRYASVFSWLWQGWEQFLVAFGT